jgi:mRNA-degrading endonuclease RelE of RelBE toxin-antitoxin system
MQYRLLISIEVVEFLERLPSKTRNALRNAIASIGGDPLAMADAVDHDDTGRKLQISIIGDFALTYWIDDADRHVKILDVHAADR